MRVSQEQAMKSAEEYAKAWCSHDPDAVASFYSEDGQIIINDGEPWLGRSGLAEMASGFIGEFPDLIVEMDSFRTSGTYAIFNWTLKGTHVNTGNYVEAGGWEYWQYNNEGLVYRSLGHFDPDDYQRQVEGN